MRTKPIVGDKAWFGPRGRLGWGWAPVSGEGWAVMVVALVALVAIRDRNKTASLITVAVLLFVCALKGTSPGSYRRREQFLRERDRARSVDHDDQPR